MKDLSISVDYSRYNGTGALFKQEKNSTYRRTDLINTLTVGKGRRPGSTFLYKMLQYVVSPRCIVLISLKFYGRLAKARSHIIYCDMDLNTEHTVYLNIHQNFMLCAMKMHNYLQAWATNTTKNATFIHSEPSSSVIFIVLIYICFADTIRQMISYNYAAIRNKAFSKLAHAHHGKCNVHQVAVFWYVVRQRVLLFLADWS